MFTFGRDHEKKCAVQYLRKPDESDLILDVVDAVHNVIEGKASIDSARSILIRAFSVGGSGVWEQPGSWMVKLTTEFPDLQSTWNELSRSTIGKVRYRVACFLNELPQPLAVEIGEQLISDRHKMTREMAIDRMEQKGTKSSP